MFTEHALDSCVSVHEMGAVSNPDVMWLFSDVLDSCGWLCDELDNVFLPWSLASTWR